VRAIEIFQQASQSTVHSGVYVTLHHHWFLSDLGRSKIELQLAIEFALRTTSFTSYSESFTPWKENQSIMTSGFEPMARNWFEEREE
jgi:hypothetical protein